MLGTYGHMGIYDGFPKMKREPKIDGCLGVQVIDQWLLGFFIISTRPQSASEQPETDDGCCMRCPFGRIPVDEWEGQRNLKNQLVNYCLLCLLSNIYWLSGYPILSSPVESSNPLLSIPIHLMQPMCIQEKYLSIIHMLSL